MHKLRNIEHQQLLNRILDIIPPGYNRPIFQEMKNKTRKFCALHNWNENKIREMIADNTWYYSWPFYTED